MRACFLFAGVLTVAACKSHPANGDMLAALTRALEQARRPGGRLPIGDLATGDWDRLEVFGPYTPQQQIEEVVGRDPRIAASGIEIRDDVVLLTFLKRDRLVAVALLPRATADFALLAGQRLERSDCLEIPPLPLTVVHRVDGC